MYHYVTTTLHISRDDYHSEIFNLADIIEPERWTVCFPHVAKNAAKHRETSVKSWLKNAYFAVEEGACVVSEKPSYRGFGKIEAFFGVDCPVDYMQRILNVMYKGGAL